MVSVAVIDKSERAHAPPPKTVQDAPPTQFEVMITSAFLFFLLTLLHFRRPDDWTLSAGGSGTIYGWGHNHRGQLGGIEGAKVKVPTPTEALATLRPVQLIGGEQTLFAVTADGKVSLRKCTLSWCTVTVVLFREKNI